MNTRTLLIFAVLLAFAAPVFAQPGPGPGSGPCRMDRKEMRAKLGLSDDQEKAMKDIRSKTQKTMIDIRSDIQKLRIDMRAIMDSDNPDRAAFEKLSRQLADKQVQQKLVMFDTRAEVRKILSPEQMKIWDDMKGERMDCMREGMKGRMGGRRGRG